MAAKNRLPHLPLSLPEIAAEVCRVEEGLCWPQKWVEEVLLIDDELVRSKGDSTAVASKLADVTPAAIHSVWKERFGKKRRNDGDDLKQIELIYHKYTNILRRHHLLGTATQQ